MRCFVMNRATRRVSYRGIRTMSMDGIQITPGKACLMISTTKRLRKFFNTMLLVLLLLPAAPLLAQAPVGDATATRGANLRAGPGTTFAIVGGAAAGQSLAIVAQNADGTWYKLADDSWIFAQLVNNAPEVPVVTSASTTPAVTAPVASAAPVAPVAPGGSATLAANSTTDWPGGKEHNFWAYLYSDGRNNFNWRDMRQENPDRCFTDTANLGLEICADSIKADKRGDVAVQWKASKGGSYRFEWDSASLKFYKHTELIGIVDAGVELPYAATVRDVIEWEQFFWVAVDSTPYHIRIFRLDDTAVPAPVAAAPIAAIATFGPGTQLVGRDIAPGTYRAPGGNLCYWERLRGFGGTVGDIIANELSFGPQIVTISATDRGFDSTRCGTWTLDLTPITSSPNAPFGDGFYFVGKDVAPGMWQSSGDDGTCYWATLSGFSGEFRDLHANDLLSGSTIVTLRAEDTGFQTQRCGTWTKIE